jgi:hypothetical protein
LQIEYFHFILFTNSLSGNEEIFVKLENLKLLSSLFRPPRTPTQYSQIQDHLRQIGLDPDNLYQELEMSYRYVQAHQDISFSNAIVSLHSHNFFEILYCRNTCGAEYLVGATRYRLQKGDVVIIRYSGKTYYLKRIVALPGEVVAFRRGILYVNGKPQKEP